MIRTPQSVDYSTPLIDSNNIRDNSNDLILAAVSDLPGTVANRPLTRSTGNNVRYIVGHLILNGPTLVGEVIATLPNNQAALDGDLHVLGTLISGGVSTAISFRILGAEIKMTVVGAAGDQIHFGGIVYLSE